MLKESCRNTILVPNKRKRVVAIIPSAPILEQEVDKPLFFELRQNFGKLKELAEDEVQRKQKCPKHDTTTSCDVACERRFELALSTLLLAESGIARLRNGINELEALLSDEDTLLSDDDTSADEDDNSDDVERSVNE